MSDFTGRWITDREVLRLAAKVGYEIDKKSEFPGSSFLSGWVKIETKDGEVHEEKLRFNRGSPRNPASREEVLQKFYSNAQAVIPKEKAKKIARHVQGIERLESVAKLVSFCVSQRLRARVGS